MSWIKKGVKLFLITISLFLLVDFVTTWLYGARGLDGHRPVGTPKYLDIFVPSQVLRIV